MNELMIRNDAQRSVAFSNEAIEARDAALAESALIGKVTNAAEQNKAVAAQCAIQRIVTDAEKARKQVKEPVLEFGRLIDDAARRFKAEAESELLRLARLIGDFQQLEQARARAAEIAKQKELEAIEKEKALALSQAKSHEQLDAIQEHFNDKAQVLQEKPTAAPARAEGQVVKEDWDIVVVDLWALARAHSLCVKIEPKLSEIKALLNAGVKVAGVKAEKVVKAGVRLPRQAPLIEV